jgi:hypothetical protein
MAFNLADQMAATPPGNAADKLIGATRWERRLVPLAPPSATSGNQRNGSAPIAFLSDADLRKLPPIEYDIEGVLPSGGITFLVGAPGSGKTLLAMEWAASIALGRKWYGRAIQRGAVNYVAGEGARSLHTRLDCWKFYHKVPVTEETGILWLPRRVLLTDPVSVTEFIGLVRSVVEPPRLIVIDTFPRCTQGTPENDSDGMGRALEGVDRIREATGAGMLLIAHPSRDGGDNPRGHSSQEGAADAVWAIKEQDGARILTCPKLKDGDETQVFSLALVQVGTSVLLLPPDNAGVQVSLTSGQRTILATLDGIDAGAGVSAGPIIDASKLSKSSVYFILKNLQDRGFVCCKGQRYRLTHSGALQLSSGVSIG